MKGIDTNVLVRYILQDDHKQSQQATYFIEQTCSNEELLFINSIVLCEFVWVLETAYKYAKKDIAYALEQILKTRHFHIHEPEILWRSLDGYRNEGADFADHYIANLNVHNGCEYTVTFDKSAGQLQHFKPISKEINH
jgi:predicted nucleic-acid-binding protein